MSEPDDIERSPSGAPVGRHEAREGFELAIGDLELIERIEAHVEEVLGPIDSIFHEIISQDVHIDLLHVPPNDRQPAHVLVTCGMSVKPMTGVVDDSPEKLELLIVLPPDWPVSDEAFKDERNYWPVRFLKLLAHLPHQYDTWLGFGHTVPNGDPPHPFTSDTALAGAIVLPPLMIDGLGLEDTGFYGVYFMHADEMDFKLREGADALLELWEQRNGATELVEPDRPSAIEPRSPAARSSAAGEA